MRSRRSSSRAGSSRSSARSRSRPSRSTSTPRPIPGSALAQRNVLPQPAAVRTEEMVNYFPYDYAPPKTTAQPFSTNVAVFPSPWSPGRKLVRIGIKGYAVQSGDAAARQPRLPDRHVGLDERAEQAAAGQAVAEHAARRARRARHGRDRHLCRQRRHRARADAGQPEARSCASSIARRGRQHRRRGRHPPGLQLAEANLDPKGVNRVILATDGDFNVGITDQDELKGYIERERGKGVFLSVLGFGMGNYNDALMQTLAQNGNGTAPTSTRSPRREDPGRGAARPCSRSPRT
jgi:Ca-activated chloride channel family protein